MATIRTPTSAEFDAFTGAHCHQLWAEVGPDWFCPACRRTKFGILRWTKRFPRSPDSFWGWHCGLAKHHDHSVGFVTTPYARFQQTVICDQCNSLDGTAKRKLKLPENFSFSVQEIAQFVTATAHGPHKIDYALAQSLFLRAMER